VRANVRGVAVITIVALLGCGGPSPTDESRDTLRSWSASVEVAATAWLTRDVPSRYFGDLLTAAADALRQERTTLARAAPSPAADSLRRVERSLAAAVERMSRSLEANDRAEVRAALDVVKSLGTPLRRETLSTSS
jgi:hypothetical protein